MTIPPLPYATEPVPPATKRGFGSGAGRAKGQQDRVTMALKEAILRAGEVVGDRMSDVAAEKGEDIEGGLAGYLIFVAGTDPKTFCGLLSRVLPMTIKGEGESGGIVVEIVRMAAATVNDATHPTA